MLTYSTCLGLNRNSLNLQRNWLGFERKSFKFGLFILAGEPRAGPKAKDKGKDKDKGKCKGIGKDRLDWILKIVY